MPPKVKITKDEILNAAIDILRIGGMQAVNARSIATLLKCSTQPIFSNFATMEELQISVVRQVGQLCREYLDREVSASDYPIYKANGMAYIRFAKEEKEMFKLLYMCDRDSGPVPESDGLFEQMITLLHQNVGLDVSTANLFHLEMWVCVHGIATMFATGFLDLEWDLVGKILTDTYQGLRKQYGME